MTKLCAVSFKQCWQDESGRWMSYGGFPLQMEAVGSLFDQMTLLIERGQPRAGGLPLPAFADVVVLPSPVGTDGRRKLSVAARAPYYLWKIARHIRRADVVHTPLPGDMPLLALILSLLLRRRLLARYGGSWIPTARTTMMNRVTRGLMRRFSYGRNVMLATGDGDRHPGGGVQWIFSTALTAAELDQIRPDLDRGLATPPRLVYIGRLSPEKGLLILLGALAKLAANGVEPLPQLTLIGDGPQRGELEQTIDRLHLRPLIRLTGQLNRDQLSEELLNQDLCVQPSLTEGFSKAWLDAMAHGLPVLASDVGAAQAVLGHDGQRGWLTAPGQEQALADRLVEILSGPVDWPATRSRCRAYVEQRTLEAWKSRIGQLCAMQWNVEFSEGKLRL